MNKKEAQEISDKIILRLKRERIKKGISQYKLAKETGMSKSSILYIETLQQKPTFYTLLLLCHYLEVDLRELLS